MNAPRVIAGKYRVVRQLGVGGMGRVLLAVHTQLDQKVAIKLLKPELTSDPVSVERFMREARAIARIQNDHVVRVSDVANDDDGTPFIVMEYLEGEDLAQRLEKRGPLPVAEAVDYVLQACVAIAEAHRVGVIHRDLKPGNLFVARRPNQKTILKVVDFGISKLTANAARPEASLTTTSRLMGSPFYMSPEQLRGDAAVDARSDIWALGMILFELLTNEGPFEAPTVPQLCMQIMEAPARRLSSVRPEVPPGLDEIIERTLAKDPNARFQDVGAFASALAPFAPHEAVEAEAATAALARPPTPPSIAPAAPPVQEGPRVTSNTWNTNDTALPKRRPVYLIAVAAGLALAGTFGVVRVVMRDAPTATASPSTPQPSVTFVPPAISPAPSASAPAPSASASASARPIASAPRANAARPIAPPPASTPAAPVTPAATGDEFGGRK